MINFFKTSPQSSLTTIKTQPANDVVVAIFHDVFDRKRAETFKLWMAHLESEHTSLREREIARKETEMQEKERKFQEKYEHLVEAGAMVLDRAKMLDEKERHLTEREKAQNERGYVLRPF